MRKKKKLTTDQLIPDKFKVKASMLKGKYEKTAVGNDDPDKRHHDKKLFNRRQEYEIIDMIQKIVDQLRVSDKAVNRIEDLIKNFLPAEKRRRDDVFEWLKSNFIKEISKFK